MRQFLTIFLVLLVMVPGTLQAADPVRDAVTSTALDYMDGGHAGAAERMARAIHPELSKLSVMTFPNGRQVLRKAGASRLVELVRDNAIPLPPGQRNIQVTVHYADRGIAAVTVTSAMFHDLLQIAEVDGSWKIVNALWTRQGITAKDETGWVTESSAIKQAALDYIEGAFSSDGDRMARAIHPALNKVIPVQSPKSGRTLLNYTTSDLLIEGTTAGAIALEKDKWNIELKILDIYENVSAVLVSSTPYVDLLQLAKLNGQWKIVGVLWVSNPKPATAKSKP